MYQLILIVQGISIIILFLECRVVFKNWTSTLHAYLFLGCASALVNSAGYFLELISHTEEAYFGALRLSYFGRVWTAFALLLVITELVKVKLPRRAKILFALVNIVTYAVVFTTRSTGLYYKNIHFAMAGRFPEFQRENGVWYYLWAAVLIFYIAFGLFSLFAAMRKGKDAAAKKRLVMVILAMLTEGLFSITEMLKLLPLTRIYNVTMLGYPISTLFMFVAIFFYSPLEVKTLARQYAVDQLSEAIIVVDANGTVSYYNKPARPLLPALGADAHTLLDTLRGAVDSGEPLSLDGRVFTPEANALTRGGTVVGTIYTLVDDTEHYRYLNELREQRRIADEANKAKSAFLANMSHEIRTPINAILGMDEIILRESAEPETLSYASDIESAGKTLLSIINDILDLSKIEEGKMEIFPAQYDLSSLVGDLVNMTRPRAEGKGLRFDVRVDENIPHLLLGDEVRIRQCALNILSNAVKYTEEGSVTMRVGYEKRGEDRIALSFSVSDTGIGMKPEDMERLFTPFARIEEQRNRNIEGTGLGMSITKQLLALMDSRLDVESVYGEGSTFSFSVDQPVVGWEPVGPLAKRYGTNAPRKSYRELFHAPDACILVVDDTPMNLTVIRGLLKKTRIRIDTAASGREALAMAARERYDVIFIDHMMPEMDGIETLHELRKLPGAENIPCVALTANAISGAREMYLEAGFSDYLSKPVDGPKLEKLLQDYLPPEKMREPADSSAPGTAAEEAAATVLIVDDDAQVCRLAESILGKHFRVEACQSGARAAETAARIRPALILLDINLGGITGFDVLRALRESEATGEIPVVFLTGERDEAVEVEGFRNGAADFVRKPFVPEVLLHRTRRIIELDRLQRNLQSEVRRQALRAERLTKEMMLALSKTVDAKDHYTKGHSERVAAYAAEIARRMGKSAREQEQIYEMGLMHDIGKIGIAEKIINKSSRLTDGEFETIKNHTVTGSEILRTITEMPELSAGARSHHERYDGSGYPDGLKGTDIPEAARIICLADCYDAMTSTRTYSSPRAQAAVRAEIERCAGAQFDPEITRVLLRMIDEDKDYMMTERTADIRVWRGSDRLWRLDGGTPSGQPGSAESPETAPGGDVSGEAETAELPDWLHAVDGLDTERGLLHCGTEKTYLDTLTIYAKNAPAAADEIEGYWNAGDVGNTTVKVHALKSMSRTVGALELGALAEKLELAGKAGDTRTLSAELGELLSRFRALGAALAPLCASDEARTDEASLPLISEEALREAYDSLRELAESMDSDSAAYVLDYLGGFRIPEDERERVELLRKAIGNFDWDRIDGILS